MHIYGVLKGLEFPQSLEGKFTAFLFGETGKTRQSSFSGE
ncbi:unnamed protein product [Cuscuta epithymum]|uniref:Uncharacterized protein n=1 Tax=Cuscuta epithymum TaxID=186058 RepID=A0AAV0CGK0_9ASTE|nr:unnamed protein product [Cuscuta epithymum]